MSVWRAHFLGILLLGASAVTSAAAGIDCTWQGSDSNFKGWVPHGASCYRWIESHDYWYPAEQNCSQLAPGAHLVSISDERENTLVGRLTYCQAAWLGRYGQYADKLGDPGMYRWTDGVALTYSAHNFSRLATPHQPLITAEELEWFNNLYHARNSYVCKAPSSSNGEGGGADGCSAGWHRAGDFCFLQPPFQATYIEAGYYCDGMQANLVSVHSERELRLLSLLDLSQAACSVELWLGLVKLNPCRAEYSSGRMQQICYRWADRSGDHLGFPAWEADHPIGDRVTNCIVLKDRRLRSEPCHMRHNFVCKRPAGLTTPEPPTVKPPTIRPPTQEPQTRPQTDVPPTHRPTVKPTEEPTVKPTDEPTVKPPTVEPPTRRPTEEPTTSRRPPTDLPPSVYMAAYNFRKGLENLAQPGRFRILDSRGVAFGREGAVLNGTKGILVDTESSALTRHLKRNKEWTIFYLIKRAADVDEPIVDVSGGDKEEPNLSLLENPASTDLTLYGSTGYFRDESDHRKDSEEPKKAWVHAAVVLSARRAYFYRNGADVSTHSAATAEKNYPDSDEHLMLGHVNGHTNLLGYRGVLACFGVVHAALTPVELTRAFQYFCADA